MWRNTDMKTYTVGDVVSYEVGKDSEGISVQYKSLVGVITDIYPDDRYKIRSEDPDREPDEVHSAHIFGVVNSEVSTVWHTTPRW